MVSLSSFQLVRHYSTGVTVGRLPLQYINGSRVVSISQEGKASDRKLYNPATGKSVGLFKDAGPECVDQAVASAKQALAEWKKFSGFERGKLLKHAAEQIRSESKTLSLLEVEDTGKPLWEARADILGCADALEFFGGIAANIKGEHISLPGGSFAYTVREAIGVVGAIGAWNYPFQMACWKSGPALACGNTMVFKPAQWTPQTAVRLAEIYHAVGIPAGVFNVVQGAAETGACLTSHKDVSKVSFTGSVEVGSKVMTAAAQTIKHVTLELGGKSPIIVFEDANVDDAVTGAMLGNWLTQGQVCSNGTRVYVHKNLIKPFLDQLITRTKAMKIGNPLHEDTRVGAMIAPEHAEKVLSYVHIAQREGATVAYGGERMTLDDPDLAGGYYLSPCVLTDCADEMRVVREEIFGAVMCVMPFTDEDEVVARANDTHFGLAAAVFTNDLRRAHRVVSSLEAGTCYINTYNIYPVEMPFGGYKQSGLGRECGEVCLQYYSQSKAVYVEMGSASHDAPF